MPHYDTNKTESDCDCRSDTRNGIEREICSVIKQLSKGIIKGEQHPKVTCLPEINGGFCRFVAVETYLRLDDPDNIKLLEHGNMGTVHVWLEYNGKHFDAEVPCGVNNFNDLPLAKRSGGWSGEPNELSIDDLDPRWR